MDYRSCSCRLHRARARLAAVRDLGSGIGSCSIYLSGIRNASVQDLAALASIAAGLVHLFPRTP